MDFSFSRVAGLIAAGIYYYFFVEKALQIRSPNGKEVLTANKTYQITWKARKIGKIGIMLVKEGAKRRNGLPKKFLPWTESTIGIFLSGRNRGRIIEFLFLNIRGKKASWLIIPMNNLRFWALNSLLATLCQLIKNGLFCPTIIPDLRKVFITTQSYNGNLEGLEGADKKCQQEAESEGFDRNLEGFFGSRPDFSGRQTES